MINESERKFKLTGLSPLLATYPAQEEIYTKFVASKCEGSEPEEGRERDYAEIEAEGLNVFPTDSEGRPILLGYQIKGFFKEAVLNLAGQNGIKAARKKIDNYLFVSPSQIPICRDGVQITEVDGRCDRPLMSNVMGKEYTSIKSSEQILDPWEITFRVVLIANTGTKTSKAVTWDVLEDALDYGMYKGFLQWRNAGNGRFRWEELK